ncbi:MAG: membrane protein [Porticoccaceae bacterium]|nr:MAG: membrane protein [Porticoccaceae bacterium]
MPAARPIAVASRLLLWLTLLALAGVARGEAQDAWTANLYLENDLFGGSDDNYTSGVRLSWISPDLASFRRDAALPHWLERASRNLDDLFRIRTGHARNLTLSLGQQLYTPEDRTARALIPDDRPYAGYLYLRLGHHSRTRRRLDSLEVDLGVVGPAALGRQAQDLIHELRSLEKFRGWDNQLKNEPILQVTYEQKRRLVALDLPGGWGADLIGHAGSSLGNLALYANLGAEFRIGYALPADFGTSAVRPGGDNSAPGRGDPRLSGAGRRGFHLFASLDGRAVARDLFLDGNTWRDSHSVPRKPLVADLAVGASVLAGRWKFSYAQVFRSKEFSGQRRPHEYGSLSLSYTW